MRRLILILFLSFFFLFGTTQSINPVFRHITRSSGLPVDEVLCIAQDNSGFMWFGTKEGLFRYDGFTYKGFYNKPGDSATIPGNNISKIYVDSKGLLWIGTVQSGLTVMRNNGKVLKSFNVVSSGNVADIKEDKKGFIWCSTGNGLFQLQKGNGSIKMVKRIDLPSYGHGTNIVGPFVFDEEDRLWMCTYKGLAIYDPAKDALYHVKNNPFHLFLLNDTLAFASIFLDTVSKKIWYSTWEPATHVYDLKTKINTTLYSGKRTALPDYNQIAGQFLTDSRKNLWMATWKGVSLFAGNTRKIFIHQNDNAFSLLSNAVNNICEDREGNFWFATAEGISITRPYHQPFLNLSGNSANEYSFAGKAVTSIIPVDSNTLLLGTYAADGLYETNMHFTVKRHFSFGTMDYDFIWKYYNDAESRQIYISTQAGMLVYNIRTHTVHKLLTPPFNEGQPVSSFVPADSGNVWMSRYRNSFFKYNLKKKTFRKYNLADLDEKPQMLWLYRDNDQALWIKANATGLLRFDEKTEKITERIVVKPDSRQGLLQSEILCLRDIGNYLFIGYETKGFSLYKKTSKAFSHFSKEDGLAGNYVSEAIQTKDGNVWIATTNGISRFDTATKGFINYNYDNGILENNFATITQLPDGRIGAGSIKGVVLFHPDSINSNKNVPPPVITDLSIYGRKVSADSLLSKRLPLHISYKENYFSIEYISLLYHNNQQVEYAYLLQGLDKDWIPAGNRRFVSYSNLKGGAYYFKVKARLPGGSWTESSFALPISVSEAFYTQGWFYFLMALFFASIVYGIYQYHLQQILRLEKIRTAISSDLHDEVGATLSSISIFSEMGRRSVDASSKAGPYLQRIGERSRESIEKMSDIIWSINPENDSLCQILVRMKNYANELLEAKNIAVHWMESENLGALKLSMTKRKNLYLLFKEVVTNAAKYSGAKNMYINLYADHRYIKLFFSDDGVGFDVDTIQAGNGLKNMQRRSASLNGTIRIESAPQTGTSIIFQFKY